MSSEFVADTNRICRRYARTERDVGFGSRENICLECRRERGRAHYAANRDYYLSKTRRRNAATTARVRSWILEYLASHPCVDCGTDDVRVLEFDHVDPGVKRAAVSVLVANG
jgi:hypothetical protein